MDSIGQREGGQNRTKGDNDDIGQRDVDENRTKRKVDDIGQRERWGNTVD